MSVSTTNFNEGLVHKEPSFKKACCILFSTKEEARNKLDLMKSIVNREGFVSVYDLYLMVGAKTCTEDDYIGWGSLDGAFIKPTWDRKEYRLILPKLDWDIRSDYT